MEIGLDKAKAMINESIGEAQEMLQNPSKIKDLLGQMEEKVNEVPGVADILRDVKLMVSMIRDYVTREYTEVSPKVIASMVSAVLYFVKKKDLIADNVPILGRLDDIAVLVGALKLCGPELEAYAAWKEGKRTAPTGEAPAEETVSETTVTEEETAAGETPEEETPGPGAEA